METQQAKEKCKLGQGELCCAYIGMSSNGWECLKGTTLEELIKHRLVNGAMNAKGDYCGPATPIVIIEEVASTSEENLDLINSMEIVDFSIGAGDVEYVHVDDNEVNRAILRKLGMTDEEINKECYPDGDVLDLVQVACLKGGADWFDGINKKFAIKE